jgi:hypothetical protein
LLAEFDVLHEVPVRIEFQQRLKPATFKSSPHGSIGHMQRSSKDLRKRPSSQ